MSVDWDDFDQTLLRAGKRHAAPSNLQKRALAAATAAGVVSLGVLAAKAPVVAAGKVATAAALGKSVGLFSRLLTLKWAFWATTATVGLASVAVVAVHRTSAAKPTVSLPVAMATNTPSGPIAKKTVDRAKALTDIPAEDQTPTSNVTLAAPEPTPAALPAPLPVAPVPRAAPVAGSASVAQKPVVVSVRAPRTASAGTNDVVVATPKAVVLAGLGEEVHLLDDARAALRRGDSARALALCSEHSARFGHGGFANEREVLRVDALLAAGRTDEARVEARAFVLAHPNAPQATRLQKVVAQ